MPCRCACHAGEPFACRQTSRLVARDDGYVRVVACERCRGTGTAPCDACGLPSDVLDVREGYEDVPLCRGCQRRQDERQRAA